jgi:hypothetical protein
MHCHSRPQATHLAARSEVSESCNGVVLFGELQCVPGLFGLFAQRSGPARDDIDLLQPALQASSIYPELPCFILSSNIPINC